MDIEIKLKYPIWKETEKSNYLSQFNNISQESYNSPRGLIFKEQRIYIFGSFDDDIEKEQESLLGLFVENLPKGIRYEVFRRKYAHHDYAIQSLIPTESGTQGGLQCPKCKKFMSFPHGITWTGTKFFCPHCYYTIDTCKEFDRQYDLIDLGHGRCQYVNWHEPTEK